MAHNESLIKRLNFKGAVIIQALCEPGEICNGKIKAMAFTFAKSQTTCGDSQ